MDKIIIKVLYCLSNQIVNIIFPKLVMFNHG